MLLSYATRLMYDDQHEAEDVVQGALLVKRHSATGHLPPG